MKVPRVSIPNVNSNKSIDRFARVGYAARAVVYGLVGLFAALIAFGYQGALTDNRGALRQLLAEPFGTILLIVLAFGLACYAVWRILQAIRDYDHRGKDAKGLAVRAGYFFGGVTHAALAYSAINLIFHLSRQSSQPQDKKVAYWLLDQPFGQLLAGLVALAIFGFGIGQIYIAIKETFTRGLYLPRDKKKWLCRICKFGLISRGVIFLIVGWLFMRAALHANANEARGVPGAWRFLAGQPFGVTLVAVVALGLIAFAVYGFAESLYRGTT